MSDRFANAIDARTRYCAVYGHPVQHSASPAMQNAGLAALGLNWRYLAFDVPPADLARAIDGAKAMRFLGLNLTVPHKLLAVDMVDHLDASGVEWRAINTVRFEAKGATGEWRALGEVSPELIQEVRSVGFNTDADAIVRSIQQDLDLSLAGASVLLLGAGGAGSVAALRLAAEGVARLYLVNRTTAKAEAVLRQLNQRYPQVKASVGYPSSPVDLVLNATSLGLKPADPLPYDPQQLALGRPTAVYDMIYRPAETRLLREARAAGCRTANGLGMLLYQGAKALEIWTERPAPLEIMRAALIANIYGTAATSSPGQ